MEGGGFKTDRVRATWERGEYFEKEIGEESKKKVKKKREVKNDRGRGVVGMSSPSLL
jgi:hypothetical protein